MAMTTFAGCGGSILGFALSTRTCCVHCTLFHPCRPGLYVGCLVLPATTTVAQLRALCARWIGLPASAQPDSAAIRLFSLADPERAVPLTVDEKSIGEFSSITSGSTIWIQPDFLLTPEDRANLGLAGPQSQPAGAAAASGQGRTNFTVPDYTDDRNITPSSDVDAVSDAENDDTNGKLIITPNKRQKVAPASFNQYDADDDDDTQEYIGNSQSQSQGDFVVDSGKNRLQLHTSTPAIEQPASPTVNVSRIRINFPDWLVYNADFVELFVYPTQASEFGAKLSQCEALARDNGGSTWNFEFTLTLSKHSKYYEVVDAIADELGHHVEVQWFLPTVSLRGARFPGDYIKLKA